MFSALLGFSAVLFLELPQASHLIRTGNKYVPLFVIVLISQVLLEIFSKYQGKMCDTIEGLFTATIALLGFLVGNALSNRVLAGSSTGFDSGYQSQTMQWGSGNGIGSNIIITALIVGLFLFIWKSWLRPRLGINIQGCSPQGGPTVTRQTTTTVQMPSPEQEPAQTVPPAESFVGGGYAY